MEKLKCWTHWKFCAYHKIFGIRKGLLARLYLLLKVIWHLQKVSYLTWDNFVSILIFLRISRTFKTYLWRTLNICFLHDLLKLHFLTRCPYFHLDWWWKREKNQFFEYFWGISLKSGEKIFQIHKYNWHLVTWILKEKKLHTNSCWRNLRN